MDLKVNTLEDNKPTKNTPAPVAKFTDITPCNWNIEATGDDTIVAVNEFSGERFEGTREDFSAALRG